MITKVMLSNNNSVKPKINFRSIYSTMSDNIYIYNKNVNTEVKSMAGNINAELSKLNTGVQTMSGDIDMRACEVEGDIKSLSGNIYISKKSVINGNIICHGGDIIINNSKLIGDAQVKGGNIILHNADITGTVETPVEDIKLKGENNIKNLIIKENNKFTTSMFGNNTCTILSAGGTVTVNGVKISDLGKKNPNALEYTLPKGTKISGMLKFESSKPGTLFLENGAEILGKIVNGIIKRK